MQRDRSEARDDAAGMLVIVMIAIVGALFGGLLASVVDVGVGDPLDVRTWVTTIPASLMFVIGYRVVSGRHTG